MKRHLLLFLAVACFAGAQAQTQPAAQPLPYQQSFTSLPPASTTYPDGWQGWGLSGSPSANFNVLPPAADKVLLTGSASSTTNGVYNYNGKLGFLNSGSADNAVVLALNTSGQTNVAVQYDVMTLRNPYDSAANTRINEVTLQYRIGTTGNFTSITGIEYQNSTTTRTGSGVTAPLDSAHRVLVLPAACDNQPLVQLRWVNRQISGGGSRPSFAIDNITAGSSATDVTPPAIDSVWPADMSIDITPAAQPIITFSESVKAGSGQIIIHNRTAGTAQFIAADSSIVYYNGRYVTIAAGLQPQQSYYVTIEPGAVLDLSDNAFGGLTDTSYWSFTTGAQQLVFDFNVCATGNISQGFRQYSVSGVQRWDCTTFGRTGNGVQINGYSGGPVENEDWLISPAFDFSGFDYPLLNFYSRTAFSGPSLQLLVSTNYDGVSNPLTASWTPVNGRFPALLSDAWILSDSVNLAAFKQAGVYVAFVYKSSPSIGAARWTVDDIFITNSPEAPAPSLDITTSTLDFDYVPAGQSSAPLPVTFQGNDFTSDLTITSSGNFTLAADSAGPYSHTLTYSPSSINAGPLSIWVRFQPTATDQHYSGAITFSADGLALPVVGLSGTSLRSLKVVNWNIEWFGSPVQNPANDSLQQANVITILKKLDADIFALAEVVDTARFRAVASQLPGYSYVISDFGSYADSIKDTDYGTAQKLAFLYKTSVIKGLRSYGVLRQGGSSNAYYHWSSGRFPFLLEARAKLNNDSALIRFVLLHAKANTGNASDKIESWHRRKNGALELKDSLDVQYPTANLVVLGDFNDAFDKTITTELAPDTTTSYIDFINDSVHYEPVTLPLSLQGKKSTASYNTVIDNVLISDEMALGYLPGSARVRMEVETLVNSYSSTTTDHYPIQTNYNLHVLAHPAALEFAASVDTGDVKLTWSSPYELNISRYIVQRSRNQSQFESVDTVAAQGTTAQPVSYETYDTRPWLGVSYYRLKIVGLDGTVSYSENQRIIVTIRDLLQKLFWCIFGNQLQIWLDMNSGGPAQLQLVDMQGRIRYQGQTILNKGRNIKSLDISGLPNGIYILRVQSMEGTQVTKILINQ
jgi:hypothetical protein